jgi:VIT1/CCC1 family predicted Fe2+/Mn2+ transporter
MKDLWNKASIFHLIEINVTTGNLTWRLVHHRLPRPSFLSMHSFPLLSKERMPPLDAKFKAHIATHAINRVGWLRAAVLGANDGILSVASILSGLAAAQVAKETILLSGIAALVAGAASMATGEFVSVSSQSDTERADLQRENRSLQTNPQFEMEELTQIYVSRGLTVPLASQVAKQLMAADALGAHARDELGISEIHTARPLQAAFASAASFVVGALLPVLVVVATPADILLPAIIGTTLLCLAILGAAGAKTGGVEMLKPTLRVLFWGALSLGLTTLVGMLFDVAV